MKKLKEINIEVESHMSLLTEGERNLILKHIDLTAPEGNNKDEDIDNDILLPPLDCITAEIERVLSRKKQVILYGPPGTGKTYHAEKACCELAARNAFGKTFSSLSPDQKSLIVGGDYKEGGNKIGLVRMCCFHPNYGYEDFIEGIKPKVIKGCTVFGLKYGIFKRLSNDAAKNPDYKYYIIIDEINRGDIPGIFGELIMLLEADKRGKEVILPLSNSPFNIPENVYIVGTMNTADRSIVLLDKALRRRFGFIELLTDYRLLEGVVIEGLPLSGWLKDLNSRICEHIGKDGRNLQIGHSYFLEKEKPVNDSDKFKRIIKEDIIPLIEEYCYGDYDLLARILGEGIVDVKNQVIRYELFEYSDISHLINALLLPCPKLRSEEATVSDDNNGDGSFYYK